MECATGMAQTEQGTSRSLVGSIDKMQVVIKLQVLIKQSALIPGKAADDDDASRHIQDPVEALTRIDQV